MKNYDVSKLEISGKFDFSLFLYVLMKFLPFSVFCICVSSIPNIDEIQVAIHLRLSIFARRSDFCTFDWGEPNELRSHHSSGQARAVERATIPQFPGSLINSSGPDRIPAAILKDVVNQSYFGQT